MTAAYFEHKKYLGFYVCTNCTMYRPYTVRIKGTLHLPLLLLLLLFEPLPQQRILRLIVGVGWRGAGSLPLLPLSAASFSATATSAPAAIPTPATSLFWLVFVTPTRFPLATAAFVLLLVGDRFVGLILLAAEKKGNSYGRLCSDFAARRRKVERAGCAKQSRKQRRGGWIVTR